MAVMEATIQEEQDMVLELLVLLLPQWERTVEVAVVDIMMVSI
jgi:hypothetical protein